jgi:NitT/TauT family transport system permease protein/taurine transport system permease protein
MASTRVLRHLVDPLLEFLRPLPPLAFIPLFIVWFGIENPSKIGLIVLGATPIVTIATLGALDAVPPDLTRAGRSLGAGRWRTLVTVRLRAALPGVVTGMRLAMGGAWASLVAAELVGADTGVGFLTLQAGNYLQMDVVFAGIGIIALLGFGTDSALRLLLRLADPSTR